MPHEPTLAAPRPPVFVGNLMFGAFSRNNRDESSHILRIRGSGSVSPIAQDTSLPHDLRCPPRTVAVLRLPYCPVPRSSLLVQLGLQAGQFLSDTIRLGIAIFPILVPSF
jgi:hypothetical protein